MNSRLQTDIVRALLEGRGFRVLAEHNLGRGLWKGIRADFVVEGIRGCPDGLAIECKWQSSTGSADEKIAYLVWNVLECYRLPCVVLCSGSELEAARDWARTKVDGERLIGVFDTDEFIAWVGSLERA